MLGRACRALLLFEAIFFAVALAISIPGRFDNFAELQPMRCLHLLYILMFLCMGGLLGKFILKQSLWRWALLFLPLCLLMWYAQRETFPSSQHIELPWRASPNPWVSAFQWIRLNTPEDAYFALDPRHMAVSGEDEHGFRAIAQRSMLADAVKDSGAASMFPALSEEWQRQVNAQQGWKDFQLADFERLKSITASIGWWSSARACRA